MNCKYLLLLVSIVFSFSVFAQEATPAMGGSSTAQKSTVDVAAQKMQMRITRILQLDEATSAKLYQPALEFFKEKTAASASTAEARMASSNSRSVALAASVEKRNAAFKTILGNEKYAALQKHIESAKATQAEGKAYSVNPDAILID